MKFSKFLNEAPLPDDWDKDKFKGRLDFKGMVDYAIQRSRSLGEGSSRVDFSSRNEIDGIPVGYFVSVAGLFVGFTPYVGIFMPKSTVFDSVTASDGLCGATTFFFRP